MATIFRQLYVPLRKTLRPRNGHLQIVPKRTMVYNKSGGILSEPKTNPAGLIIVAGVVFTSVYIGQKIGKLLAGTLEELEIYVPDDDED
jgi:hypothetical protein